MIELTVEKHLFPVELTVKIILEKLVTITICMFVVLLGFHPIWHEVLRTINISFIIYYVAVALLIWSLAYLLMGVAMILKYDWENRHEK